MGSLLDSSGYLNVTQKLWTLKLVLDIFWASCPIENQCGSSLYIFGASQYHLILFEDAIMFRLTGAWCIWVSLVLIRTFLESSWASFLIVWASEFSLKPIKKFGPLWSSFWTFIGHHVHFNQPKVIVDHPYTNLVHLNVIGSSIDAPIISKCTGP